MSKGTYTHHPQTDKRHGAWVGQEQKLKSFSIDRRREQVYPDDRIKETRKQRQRISNAKDGEGCSRRGPL